MDDRDGMGGAGGQFNLQINLRETEFTRSTLMHVADGDGLGGAG